MACLLMGAFPVTAADKPNKKADSAAVREPGIPYTFEIDGAPTSVVRALLKQTSQMEELKKRPPATAAALARRIRADVSRFQAVLESEGFYAAKVSSTTEPRGESTDVRIAIDAGPLYTVAKLTADFGNRAEAVRADAQDRPELTLQEMIGKPARARDVIAVEDAAVELLRRNGFPFARRGDRQLTIDNTAHTVSILLPIAAGRRAVFGTTAFKGQQRTNESYLQRIVPWKPARIYDTHELELFRRALVRSSLFSSVRVLPALDEEAPDGAPLETQVDLTEGPTRTISAAAKYARDTGFGGSVGWQHRNMFGNAEKLDLSLDANQLTQTANAALTRPNWRRLDQTQKFSAVLQRSTTDAFDGQSAQLLAGVERRIAPHWTVGAATSAEIARLIEHGLRRRSLLFGLPLTATRYVTDDIYETAFIDATKGWRFAAIVTPYVGSYVGPARFVRSEVEGDVYIPMNALQTFVLAGRLKIGSIIGSTTERIPADRRFYAGGGGSIRGYGYQLVSPLDVNGDPTGGRSLIESSLEARVKVTRTIGVVPFVDAGSVSSSSLPGQGMSLRVAAGLGLRYYTGVGPLRVDFALPLNKRPGVDKGFQFYLSFGQAF